MKNQHVKGITMVMAIAAIVLTAAVASANAQSAQKTVADIPFDFVVGNQTLGAGEYIVKSSTAPASGLMIQNTGGKSLMTLTIPIEPRRNRHSPRLVFHRYGQSYFLAEVWTGSGSVGRQLLKSSQERAIQRELSSIASKSKWSESSYEIVEVVAVLR